jgi:hypothetical protein
MGGDDEEMVEETDGGRGRWWKRWMAENRDGGWAKAEGLS